MPPASSRLSDVLRQLDRGLRELYGARYRGLVLYGSHARGEAVEGSDVDLLLLLDGPVSPLRELRTAEQVAWPLALEADLVLSVVPVSAESFDEPTEPFLRRARREGRRIA